jgi:hypothetical protein
VSKILVGFVICAVLCALNFSADAQQAKVAKIGWLFVRPAESDYGREMTRRALRDLGYVENKNISSNTDMLIIRSTGSPFSRMSWFA